MTGFLDITLPPQVPGYPCISVPRTRTSIRVAAGGGEGRNQEWEHPLRRFILPEAAGRDWSVIEGLKDHWLVTAGPAYSWAWRDPLDFASCELEKPNVVPLFTMTDQAIGTGDGITEIFQLTKTYSRLAHSYVRKVHLPVLSTVLIAINSVLVPDTNYTVSRPGGEIQFDVAPADGDAISWGGLFDCEVRFEGDDALEAILRTCQVGGFADINLIEVRPC